MIQKLTNKRRLVNAQIVQDDVDRLTGRTTANDVFEERDKLNTGVTLRRVPDHPAGSRIQCGEQGQRTVPEVFKSVPLGTAGR